MSHRIAITGMGAVCAYGAGTDALWNGLLGGRSGLLGPSELGGVWPVGALPAECKGSTSELGIAVAEQALIGLTDRSSLAIVGATTSGGMLIGEEAFRQSLLDDGAQPDGLLWSQLCHGLVRDVRRKLGASGLATTVSTACTSGTVALGLAKDLIEAGRADRVLVVGADALCKTTLFGFGVLGVESEVPCRPFDVERSGMNLGEGAGALLVEREDCIDDRPVLGWLLGYGNASDAQNLAAPDPEGASAEVAIREALGSYAGSDVGFVSAHGTATHLNDAMEARVLSSTVPAAEITGIKGAIGHTLGAAGTIEAIVALLALRHGIAPGTIGLEQGIDGCRVSSSAVPLNTSMALSVNFAFGGHNAAILLGRGQP